MATNQKDQARGVEQTVMPPERATAMETPAVSAHSPLPWATGEKWGDVIDANGRAVAQFVNGDVQERVISTVNAHDELVAALKEARSELEIVFHKFERAGGIWHVADRGVQLGANSWASNVENGLNNTRAVLDAAIAKAEGR